MRKIINWMASAFYIKDGSYLTLMEEHELGTGENSSRKMDPILAVPSYNVRKG